MASNESTGPERHSLLLGSPHSPQPHTLQNPCPVPVLRSKPRIITLLRTSPELPDRKLEALKLRLCCQRSLWTFVLWKQNDRTLRVKKPAKAPPAKAGLGDAAALHRLPGPPRASVPQRWVRRGRQVFLAQFSSSAFSLIVPFPF